MEDKNITGRNLVPVLSIAGSDCSGGAGIQADLKTILANDCYGMSAITALTAQNTMGVTGILDVPTNFLRKQLDAVFSDIPPKAVKIGMVSDQTLIAAIADALIDWKAENIVVDPVMVATSGSRLLKEDAISCLMERLLPLATLLTPNIPEAELLTGLTIRSKADMEQAGRYLYERYQSHILIKGGHAIEDASDVLVGTEVVWFQGTRIDNPNTHGTGCTLSSAIACGLAKGKTVVESIADAKRYLEQALLTGLNLGHGSGPLDHGFMLADREKIRRLK